MCGVIKIDMAMKPFNKVKKVLNGPSFSTLSVTNSFALLDAVRGDSPINSYLSYLFNSSSESLSVV